MIFGLNCCRLPWELLKPLLLYRLQQVKDYVVNNVPYNIRLYKFDIQVQLLASQCNDPLPYITLTLFQVLNDTYTGVNSTDDQDMPEQLQDRLTKFKK